MDWKETAMSHALKNRIHNIGIEEHPGLGFVCTVSTLFSYSFCRESLSDTLCPAPCLFWECSSAQNTCGSCLHGAYSLEVKTDIISLNSLINWAKGLGKEEIHTSLKTYTGDFDQVGGVRGSAGDIGMRSRGKKVKQREEWLQELWGEWGHRLHMRPERKPVRFEQRERGVQLWSLPAEPARVTHAWPWDQDKTRYAGSMSLCTIYIFVLYTEQK